MTYTEAAPWTRAIEADPGKPKPNNEIATGDEESAQRRLRLLETKAAKRRLTKADYGRPTKLWTARLRLRNSRTDTDKPKVTKA